MGFTPEQIKGRIKSVAKQNNADARTLMRIYMMERFLERLAQSEYRDNFIIKGGILVTAMIGVAHRSTMDIDTSMKNLNLSAEDVLPEFEQLRVIKAIQSAAGNATETGYNSWFDALNSMKMQMDEEDYDIALIGCGAYGMSLAAHAKRKGKIAIHLAGWTQMLFGIYGKRWLEDQPQYSRFINEYWVRPDESERPKNADTIEGACYW